MCGIAGYVRTVGEADSPRTIAAMLASIAHRGPDDEGITLIEPRGGSTIDLSSEATACGVPGCVRAEAMAGFSHGIALGHRRFSIIDLSPAGHQPFWSADREVCVVFNGEIYNYVELRRELQALGRSFRTDSDTEVLVEGYRQWGTDCFVRFAGFWAIALYDARRRGVLLARDRIGKAPLYIASKAGAFWWSSEINGLLTVLGRNTFPIREAAVADYITWGYRDVYDQTFYEGIRTFPRAAFGWVGTDGTIRPQVYWTVPESRLSEADIGPEEAATELRLRLQESMRIRLRADVPVAIELSGGMDSSSLAAIAATSGARLHAYSVRFPGTAADELEYAVQVAQRYQDRISLTVLEPPRSDFLAEADYYVGHMAEPFHSPNMLTNQQIWRAMAADGIRVSLNGAAGDELLAGYWGISYVPFLADLLRHGRLRRFHHECCSFSEDPVPALSSRYLGRTLRAVKSTLKCAMPRMAGWVQRWSHRDRLGHYGIRLPDRPTMRPVSGINQVLIENMTDWQMNYWMRSGNQSSMGVPLEVRGPFLDHRVVELAFRLPLTYLVRDGWLKWALRAAMRDLLPEGIVWRKRKMGFPFPYREWLTESKQGFFTLIGRMDCPYINTAALFDAYDGMAQHDPILLWRVMSVGLWWKKCVLGESLSASPGGDRDRCAIHRTQVA